MSDRMDEHHNASNVHVAFLRGINVSGRRKIQKKILIELFSNAGCDNVQTYIQSGNVFFRADKELVRQIPTIISKAISDRLGFEVPVITRSLDELRIVVGSNSFLRSGADPKKLHVVFLATRPDDSTVAMLDPNRSLPDEFIVRGKEIFLHCPNGLSRTKLTNDYFDKKLGTISTVRNWRVVSMLLRLAEKAA